MRGQPSLPVRLNRMEQQRGAYVSPLMIAELAEEYGLHPDEVRDEMTRFQQHVSQYGREPADVLIRRTAAEFGLDEGELWAECERIASRLGQHP